MDAGGRGGVAGPWETGVAGTAVSGLGAIAAVAVAVAAGAGLPSGEASRAGRLQLVLLFMVYALNSSTAIRPMAYIKAVRTQGVKSATCQWFSDRGWRRRI